MWEGQTPKNDRRLSIRLKVLYLGVSDTPAWIVSKANQCKMSLMRVILCDAVD